MANPLDTDAGSELFSSYEADLSLLQADLNQKLDQIAELTGEERKGAIRLAERAVDEANELLDQMRLEKENIPTASRSRVNARFRNFLTDIDSIKRKLRSSQNQSAPSFGDRYTDDPEAPMDQHMEQRQQLLSGTERLGRSTARLQESQMIANETEDIGRSTLQDLFVQRETLEGISDNLGEGERYVDRSVKTLRSMARRMATNRVITVLIIAVLIILIFAVIFSKFH